MTMARRVFCVLAVAALTACAATSTPADGPSYTVGVVQGQRSVIPSENLALELTSVDDSRCPPKVQCVQAGAVSVTLRLQQAGVASELITLGMPGSSLRPGEGRSRCGRGLKPRALGSGNPRAWPLFCSITGFVENSDPALDPFQRENKTGTNEEANMGLHPLPFIPIPDGDAKVGHVNGAGR